MNWNKVPRLDERRDNLEFLFTRVPAHMDWRLTSVGVINLRTPPVKVIHHPADSTLVSGNMPRGKNNRVTSLDLEILVVIQCEPRQRRHRLALAAAGHNADLLTRVISNFFCTDDQTRRNLEKAQLLGGFCVLRHSSPKEAHHTS